MESIYIIFVIVLAHLSYIEATALSCSRFAEFSATPHLHQCSCEYPDVIDNDGKFPNIDEIHTLSCIGLKLQDDFELSTLPVNIKNNLQKIVITGNNFTILHQNLFGACMHNEGSAINTFFELKHLDLSDNKITDIAGKTLHCMGNLEILKLTNNLWQPKTSTTRVFSDLEELKELHLDDAFNEQPGNSLEALRNVFHDSHLYKLETLYMRNNNLAYINETLMEELPQLKQLYLTGNGLMDPFFYAKDCQHLESLYLNDNSISRLSVPFMKELTKMPSLQHLDLRDNPWDCTCNGRDFHHWVVSSNLSDFVMNKSELKCSEPVNIEYNKIVDVQNEDLVCKEPHIHSQHAGIALLYVLIGLVIVAVLIGAFIHRKKVQKVVSAKFNQASQVIYRKSKYDELANPITSDV